MKNYKHIIPIALLLVFVLGFYMLYSSNKEEQEQYDFYLKEARYFRSIEIPYDAEINYLEAANVKPSLKLYKEIAEFYIETDEEKAIVEWGEKIIEDYPKESFGYEYLMKWHESRAEYASCFMIYENAVKREAVSKDIKDIYEKIENYYFFNYSFEDVGVFDSGLCPVNIGGKWGFVDEKGSKIIPYVYDEVGYFGDERAVVVLDDETYYIDNLNNKRIKIVKIKDFQKIGRMENMIFSLLKDNLWGVYSFKNREEKLLFGGFKKVSSIYNGVIAAYKDDGWYLYNINGKDLTGKKYDDVVIDERGAVYVNERVFLKTDGLFYMTDAYGKKISDIELMNAKHFCPNGDLAAVMIKGQWGFMNKDGKIVIEPQYDDARSFSNGYAAVRKDGMWGFIDIEGNMVIQPQFENVKDFNTHGCVFVRGEEGWELLRLYKYNY